MKIIATALLASITMACVSLPDPSVHPLRAADALLLAGEWHGEFRSDDGQRFGRMTFTLGASADTARGDVLLLPMEYAAAPGGASVPMRVDVLAPVNTSVTFVTVTSGVFAGVLPAVMDQRRLTMTQRTFVGRMTRWNVIEGTYIALGPDLSVVERGSWRVLRAD